MMDSALSDVNGSKWYYTIGEKQLGPFSSDEIKQRIFEGKITYDTLLWTETFANWTSMKETIFSSIPLPNCSSSDNSMWFYEIGGEKRGPATKINIEKCIDDETITYGTLLWTESFTEWVPVEQTAFANRLRLKSPPPLPSNQINNTVVWLLAFAPLLGMMLENFLANTLLRDKVNIDYDDLWFITVILNLILFFFDINILKKSGYNTSKITWTILLIPVYLYKRSTMLHQSKSYFIAWIISFTLILL